MQTHPRIAIGNSTFSNADRVASKLNVWNTKPILESRRAASDLSVAVFKIGDPNRVMTPSVATSMVPIRFSRDVLPPPLGPRICKAIQEGDFTRFLHPTLLLLGTAGAAFADGQSLVRRPKLCGHQCELVHAMQ